MAEEDIDMQVEAFHLNAFFPYLLRRFSQSVSGSVTSIYKSEYDMSVSEWRTMLVLGDKKCLAAKEIVEASTMDKVSVSRAVASMQKKGLLKRNIDGDDKRRLALHLTDYGREAYFKLLPRALRLQQRLLSDLSKDEIDVFFDLMERISAKIED